MNIANYKVVPLEKLWVAELLPILKEDEALRDIHKEAMALWSEGRGVSLSCLGDEPHAAWRLTTSDYHYTRVEELVAEALPEALCELYEQLDRIPEDEQESLWEQIEELSEPFYPTERSPHYWASRHACHAYVGFALCLAHAWKPEGEWKIATSDTHSTVISEKLGEVFDILLFEDTAKTIAMVLGGDFRITELNEMLEELVDADFTYMTEELVA